MYLPVSGQVAKEPFLVRDGQARPHLVQPRSQGVHDRPPVSALVRGLPCDTDQRRQRRGQSWRKGSERSRRLASGMRSRQESMSRHRGHRSTLPRPEQRQRHVDRREPGPHQQDRSVPRRSGQHLRRPRIAHVNDPSTRRLRPDIGAWTQRSGTTKCEDNVVDTNGRSAIQAHQLSRRTRPRPGEPGGARRQPSRRGSGGRLEHGNQVVPVHQARQEVPGPGRDPPPIGTTPEIPDRRGQHSSTRPVSSAGAKATRPHRRTHAPTVASVRSGPPDRPYDAASPLRPGLRCTRLRPPPRLATATLHPSHEAQISLLIR